MSFKPPPLSERASVWLRRYWIWMVVLLFALAMLPSSLRKPASADWLNTYVLAAQEMVAHQPIHSAGRNALNAGPFTYPPAAALLAVPFASSPAMFALFAWYIASLVATCNAVDSAWRLAGGPSLARMTRHWSIIFAIGLLLALRYLTSPFGNRQIDMFVAAMVLIGCWFLAQRRDVSGAVYIGIAAAIKATPLLFAPYLAWRGRWLAAAVVGAIALGLNLLPDVVWPQKSGESYLAQWREISLAPVRSGMTGEWFADPLRNQSIAGVVGRIARFGFFASPAQIAASADATNADSARAAKLLTYAVDLLLLGITAFCLGWRRRDNSRTAVEFGAVVCLMLLLSPMTSKSHLCVLILPLFLIARQIVERRTARWIAFGVALALLGPLAARDVIGRELSDYSMAWGLPVLFILLNLAGMWTLARTAPLPDADSATTPYST